MDGQNEKLEILSLFSFYQHAPDSLKKEIEQQAGIGELPAGAFYFHEGEACTRIGLVGSGDIRVYKAGDSGREITLYHVRRGETCILTASCILADVSYPATACVEQTTQAVVFPAHVFRHWVATQEIVREFVFTSLARRMADVMSLIDEISFRKLDARLAGFLLSRFTGQGTAVRVLHLTHEQIAVELGSAREVVSRLLKEFERCGAISLARGRVYLRDESWLDKVAASG